MSEAPPLPGVSGPCTERHLQTQLRLAWKACDVDVLNYFRLLLGTAQPNQIPSELPSGKGELGWDGGWHEWVFRRGIFKTFGRPDFLLARYRRSTHNGGQLGATPRDLVNSYLLVETKVGNSTCLFVQPPPPLFFYRQGGTGKKVISANRLLLCFFFLQLHLLF